MSWMSDVFNPIGEAELTGGLALRNTRPPSVSKLVEIAPIWSALPLAACALTVRLSSNRRAGVSLPLYVAA